MSITRGFSHLLNSLTELFDMKAYSGYLINNGVDHYLSQIHYNDRAIELPFLFKNIDEPVKCVLDIGCSESPVSIQLAIIGYKVTGIDLRKYSYSHPGFSFIQSDFLKYDFREKFDIIVNISAIEHFGLVAYGSKVLDMEADLKTMKKAGGLLKSGGQLIFTSPYGVASVMNTQRVYGRSDITSLFDGFEVKKMEFYGIFGNSVIRQISQAEADEIRWHKTKRGLMVVSALKSQ